ncbi:MAG: ABC transporter substrate-binding protein [Bacteroidetes bacterium]|nr:MAG: ABC transporter substrate-binding protein [Bacteroidota bacterium]
MKKISRKHFLSKSAAALAGGSLLATACGTDSDARASGGAAPNIQTNKTYRWKMVTTWPPNFPVLGEGCQKFAQWVEEMSGGRLKIQVFGGGTLVPPLEVFDAVQSGTAEMGNGAAYYWAGKIPAAPFFSTVPFGMNAQQMTAWLTSGGGMDLWEELYAPYNLIPMMSGNTGVQMGGWFNKEINSIDDLRGLKMRIPGLGGQVLTKAGGTAVQVAGGEIYTNLERGVIDATEWISPFHDYKLGFHQIAKYYYYPGWHEAGTALETLVNKAKMEQLPPDLQAILRTAAARQYVYTLSELETQNAIYLEKMQQEGVDIRPFPPEVLSRLKELTAEVLDELCSRDARAKRIYDAYRAYQQRAQKWAAISEKMFYEQFA